MAGKHSYKFEVIVEHSGTRHDFDYFFSKRRKEMSYEVKEICHTVAPYTDQELAPAYYDKVMSKTIKQCIKMAGFIIVKRKDLYRGTGVTMCFWKSGDHYRLATRLRGLVGHITNPTPTQVKLTMGIGRSMMDETSWTVDLADPNSFQILADALKTLLK